MVGPNDDDTDDDRTVSLSDDETASLTEKVKYTGKQFNDIEDAFNDDEFIELVRNYYTERAFSDLDQLGQAGKELDDYLMALTKDIINEYASNQFNFKKYNDKNFRDAWPDYNTYRDKNKDLLVEYFKSEIEKRASDPDLELPIPQRILDSFLAYYDMNTNVLLLRAREIELKFANLKYSGLKTPLSIREARDNLEIEKRRAAEISAMHEEIRNIPENERHEGDNRSPNRKDSFSEERADLTRNPEFKKGQLMRDKGAAYLTLAQKGRIPKAKARPLYTSDEPLEKPKGPKK